MMFGAGNLCHTLNTLVGPGDEEYLERIWFHCSDEEMGEDGLGKVWWCLGCIPCLCAWVYQRFGLTILSRLRSDQPLAPHLLCHGSLCRCMLLLT